MTRLFAVFLVIVAAAGPGLAADQPVDVGRVMIVDGCEGYVIAAFPNGQRLIYVGKHSIWRYQVGDQIRVDAFGRPQPPA